jgi:hypothetical protein
MKPERRDFDENESVTLREPERFQAKWVPVRVKKTRQNKNRELWF